MNREGNGDTHIMGARARSLSPNKGMAKTVRRATVWGLAAGCCAAEQRGCGLVLEEAGRGVVVRVLGAAVGCWVAWCTVDGVRRGCSREE